ncbi:MAG: PBP1A family penicillin-binding protein [Parvularculaceae bacterium]
MSKDDETFGDPRRRRAPQGSPRQSARPSKGRSPAAADGAPAAGAFRPGPRAPSGEAIELGAQDRAPAAGPARRPGPADRQTRKTQAAGAGFSANRIADVGATRGEALTPRQPVSSKSASSKSTSPKSTPRKSAGPEASAGKPAALRTADTRPREANRRPASPRALHGEPPLTAGPASRADGPPPDRPLRDRAPKGGDGFGGGFDDDTDGDPFGDTPRRGALRRVVDVASFLATLGLIGAVAIGAVAAIYLNKLGQDLPDYRSLAVYKPPVTTRVYGDNGTLVAEFARERRLFVPADAMPPLVKEAFISAEDKKFYDHGGIDFKGVVRSQISNIDNILSGRRLEGGSTITQQVAKNFLLSSEQKLDRKMKEWLISRRIERAFTKDQILELYLNEIYLGNRSYGVAAAALNYFDKPLNDLTTEEAAYLAAIPKGPSNYHPVRHYERARDRRNWVIGRMVADGKIPSDEGARAQATPLEAEIAPPLGARDWTTEYFAEEVRKQIAERYGVEALYDGGLAVRTTVDPALQAAAGAALRRWLVDYDQRHGWRGPLGEISLEGDWANDLETTTAALIDAREFADDLAPWRLALVLEAGAKTATIAFDEAARGEIPLAELVWARKFESVDKLGPEVTKTGDVLKPGDVVLVEPLDRGETDAPRGDDAETSDGADAAPGSYALRQVPAVNGGLVALDPHTGRVRAMVGGFSFQLSEFNRAVQASRQPGSTFKPFVYATALDNGYTPSSIVLDAPFVAPSVGSWWKPGNYVEGRFYGESTLRLGIEQSRNTMTARLAQDLGIGRIIDYAERFNLADNLPRELAISLGSGETTLMRMTAAYATFVNGGKSVSPFVIDRVQDRGGKTIFRRAGRECPECNAEDWEAQAEPQLSDLRRQVIDSRTAYQMVSMLEGVVLRGTGRRVGAEVDKPIAGKTGTTNEYKDAWFVGFSPDLAAGVYVGYDLPASLGNGEAGGKVAAPIFADFMAAALEDEAAIPFRIPSGVRLVRVNAKTGEPARAGDGNVILEAFKTGDVVKVDRDEDMDIDPLSARPTARPPDEDEGVDELNGLY